MGIIYSKCYNGVIMVGGFADEMSSDIADIRMYGYYDITAPSCDIGRPGSRLPSWPLSWPDSEPLIMRLTVKPS